MPLQVFVSDLLQLPLKTLFLAWFWLRVITLPDHPEMAVWMPLTSLKESSPGASEIDREFSFAQGSTALETIGPTSLKVTPDEGLPESQSLTHSHHCQTMIAIAVETAVCILDVLAY